VIEAHAGQIEIASQLGHGSQFTIKLPHSSLEAEIESSAQMRPDNQQPWRILVVDDEENVARTLESNLKKLPNCEVFVANDGERALQLLAHQPFQLVITDYRMPGMDGLTLAERVRQLYPNTVIIMITAYWSDNLLSRAAHASIWKILDKPVEISTIRSVTLEALTRV
jgi:CheY-like chemotaxis protein